MLVFLTLLIAQTPALPAPGAPTLELDPPQVMVAPGSLFRVKAKTNAGVVFFDVEGVSQPPEDWPLSDRKTSFYGVAPALPGQFTLTATVFGGDQRVIKKLPIIVGTSPIPPDPKPGPGPNPSDTFAAEIQALFSKSTGQNKRDKLIQLWQSAIPQVLDNPEFQTIRQFAETMKVTGSKFPFNLVSEDMKAIRDKKAIELATACGGADATLGPPRSECRQKAAAVLERYSAALAQCK